MYWLNGIHSFWNRPEHFFKFFLRDKNEDHFADFDYNFGI